MEAKKILDDSLKQDGFFSQESVMPQYTSCFKAVKKALTTSLTDTEEKMYSIDDIEAYCEKYPNDTELGREIRKLRYRQ